MDEIAHESQLTKIDEIIDYQLKDITTKTNVFELIIFKVENNYPWPWDTDQKSEANPQTNGILKNIWINNLLPINRFINNRHLINDVDEYGCSETQVKSLGMRENLKLFYLK